MSLSDFADRQKEWLQEELGRRQAQVKREIPRPFGQVEVDEAEQVQKLIDFRVGLVAAEQGDEQAMEAITEMREQFGLKELVSDFLRVNQIFEKQFEEGEGG